MNHLKKVGEKVHFLTTKTLKMSYFSLRVTTPCSMKYTDIFPPNFPPKIIHEIFYNLYIFNVFNITSIPTVAYHLYVTLYASRTSYIFFKTSMNLSASQVKAFKTKLLWVDSMKTRYHIIIDSLIFQTPHEERGPLPIPMVKICATMWHESVEEMASLIKSLCR